MTKRRKKTFLFGSILVALPLVVAIFYYNTEQLPPPPPKNKATHRVIPQNPYVDDLVTLYDHAIREIVNDTGIPGAAIAIVKDSSIIYLQGLGVKIRGGNDSIDQHTVFRIGSVSKCFAAVLTAILVEEKVFNWDDPVIKYLPDFQLKSPEQTSLLTIRHVLSHTTGLPYH